MEMKTTKRLGKLMCFILLTLIFDFLENAIGKSVIFAILLVLMTLEVYNEK